MVTRPPTCLKELPEGLIDEDATQALTLNWAVKAPVAADFNLPADEPPATDWMGSGRLVFALQFLAFVSSASAFAVPFVWSDHAVLLASVALGLALVLGAGAGALMAREATRANLRQRWHAYHQQKAAFAATRPWRQQRADPQFWRDLGARQDGRAFEIECAELLAAFAQSWSVALTREQDDYGADILASGRDGTIVAQCKLRASSAPRIATIRELAGTKAFFGAGQALLFSITPVHDQSEQARRFAETCNLQYWDLNAIVALAQHLARE